MAYGIIYNFWWMIKFDLASLFHYLWPRYIITFICFFHAIHMLLLPFVRDETCADARNIKWKDIAQVDEYEPLENSMG